MPSEPKMEAIWPKTAPKRSQHGLLMAQDSAESETTGHLKGEIGTHELVKLYKATLFDQFCDPFWYHFGLA